MRLDALQDFLPLDRTLDVKTVRYDTLKVAKRLEAELGDEQPSCIEGDASDWDLFPLPEGSLKVGIDGGYVRNWVDKKRHFEVIVGKSTLSFGEGEEDKTPWHKRFGFVQTYDDAKPKRRLYEVLHAQGWQMNQEMTFLADGNDTLRELQLEMSPKATHILDWFHLTMKLTVLGQYGKGLVQCETELGGRYATRSSVSNGHYGTVRSTRRLARSTSWKPRSSPSTRHMPGSRDWSWRCRSCARIS